MRDEGCELCKWQKRKQNLFAKNVVMNRQSGWGNVRAVKAGIRWLRSLNRLENSRAEAMLRLRQLVDLSRNRLYLLKVIRKQELVRRCLS